MNVSRETFTRVSRETLLPPIGHAVGGSNVLWKGVGQATLSSVASPSTAA